MLVIRPIEQRDFPTLKQFAIESGHGFTSLPVNDPLLQQKIDDSAAAFANLGTSKSENLYFFVAEDSDTAEVLGTCAINSAVGLSAPFYTYLLGKQVHSSPQLGIYNIVETLTLTNDYTGCSELCSLFLREPARQGLNGRLLAKSRFLFMAEFSELFDHRILAEMRGVSDEQGHSPFWGWLQEHFFSMDFPTVDYLTGIGQKGFIAELMPKFPIYVNLLSKDAKSVIGVTHHNTKPALRFLKEEGFTWRGYVDIFDGGPSVECELSQIRSVQNSQQYRVRIGEVTQGSKYLISNGQFAEFRALISEADVSTAISTEAAISTHITVLTHSAEPTLSVVTLSETVANLLKVSAGDTVRLVEI